MQLLTPKSIQSQEYPKSKTMLFQANKTILLVNCEIDNEADKFRYFRSH